MEFLTEVLLELLFQLGFRRVVDIFKHPVIMSAIFGIISGIVSLVIFKDLFIIDDELKVINLIITPVIVGALMAGLGRLYRYLGFKHSVLDTFVAGFSFAIAMTLVRFIWSIF